MKISLIHPTRGRAIKSLATISTWLDRAHTPANIEVIVSVDSDDPQLAAYRVQYDPTHRGSYNYKLVISDNKSVVEATNKAAAVATGKIFIYVSDDFECPWNWDIAITEQFQHEGGRPLLVKVDDCLQKFDVAVLTIPIMNRALYETLGYFWHPAYKSMFVDEDLYWTVRKLGGLKFAPGLKFPHNHVSIGKAPMDATYQNSAKNWDSGKAMFATRKAAGFPV